MLACIREPGRIEERPSLESLLAGLDRSQLQALVVWLVERWPDLIDAIEAKLQASFATPTVSLAPPAQAGPTAAKDEALRQRRTPVDTTVYRRQVRVALHSLDRMRASEAYWHVGEVVDEIRQVLRQAQDFVTAGDGRTALAILEAITEEYMAGWIYLDDSDGEASAFFADMAPVWTEALLTADLTLEERQAWARKLTKWQGELDNYGVEEAFDAALAAAHQGWDSPPLVRVLQGKITEKGVWEGEAPWFADDLAVARLNVLERQGRYQEYLYLAEAEGQTERYVTMLVRLGRVQEAVNYGLQYLDTPEEALTLAKALREREEFQNALRIAEYGLSLQGPRAPLATWLSELALGMGEAEKALEAATIAFRDSPTLSAYLRVKHLADTRWPEIKQDLLAYLKGKGYIENKVDIYLEEGMVNEAVQVVDTQPYMGYGVLERVVDAAIQSHPDWVIQQCRQQAESIMDQGKSRYYDHAVRWLEKARAAYRAVDREAEWQAYLHQLITHHRRKYSLVPRLEALRR
ncbi:MAG: SWIM zinc finger domain-containing protein [Nitrospinota bacterium]|nr:MAG: SWIM zinc finger domain-containing protein [Nitrospinota bacterium]